MRHLQTQSSIKKSVQMLRIYLVPNICKKLGFKQALVQNKPKKGDLIFQRTVCFYLVPGVPMNSE